MHNANTSLSTRRREGHGNINLESLFESGRRLTSVDFVVVATVVHDIFQHIETPWAAAVQGEAAEPWVIEPRRQANANKNAAALALITASRRMLRVIVLLRQHAPWGDIKSFTRALIFATPAIFSARPRRLSIQCCMGSLAANLRVRIAGALA